MWNKNMLSIKMKNNNDTKIYNVYMLILYHAVCVFCALYILDSNWNKEINVVHI